ncbi:hypothetical protein, partial [Streptomyces sp. GbtcB7]|uniref:hypothetical protein n=1 Tax=Streptomyces sp. GbtcB7 TaxID=2824752 RepID=UPI001C30BA4A
RYAAGRLELQSSIDEALPTSWVSSEASQRKLLAAAWWWVEKALQDGGSMFSTDGSVWSAPTVSALRELWERSVRVEGKNFDESLQIQLEGQSDAVKLLMAEIVALQVLPISQIMGHKRKTEKVQAVLDLMAHKVSV